MQWLIVILILAISNTSSFADGPSAWLRIDYSDSSFYEDGDKTQESDQLSQNYYFQFNKSINPLISYQLYLRVNLSDSHSKNSEGQITKTFQRSLEPALNIQFRNPMYGINAGYRRSENWSTARITNESRRTRDFYYARFDLTPAAFPFLSLQFDEEKAYDHLSDRRTDITRTRYSANSWYDIQYKGFDFSYNLTFARNENKTPLLHDTKNIQHNLNASYNIKYQKSFWRNIISINAGYYGNYSWNESKQFTTATGPVLFKREPSLGIYGLGTLIEPEVETLSTVNALSDEIFDAPVSTISGTINLGSNGERYHNIGIQLFSSERPVDSLYIYVNEDISLDTVLTNPANWRVFASDFNLPGTWTEITIQSVTISEYFDDDIDELIDVYRYEIRFVTPQNNLYFKVINLDTLTIQNVLVTEIEAYGTDNIPETGKLTTKSTFFTQGINFNMSIRPMESLIFSLNYFLDRSDQNPKSFADSFTGVFKNIISKSLKEEDEKFKTNVTRSYGASATWLAHELLTTTLVLQRSEAFDNGDKTDFKNDTYSLSFYGTPLQTINATLSLARTYSYSFNEKQSMSDLYFLTLDKKLYKNVNMVTDIGYTVSKNFAIETDPSSSDTKSTTKYIRGTIDAHLTPELSTNITFGITRTSADVSSSSKDGGLIVTYRPGRFISFAGSFTISDVDGDVSTREGISIDWLFLPTIRLNASYEHSNTKPGSRIIDNISGYFTWYITKFINLQVTSAYNRTRTDKKTESYTFGANLTCRFW